MKAKMVSKRKPAKSPKRRQLSPEARALIFKAAKARWAKFQKAKKK